MEEKISEIFLSNMFECDSFACRCVKDIENVVPDEPPKTTLKLYADIEHPLCFSYSPKEGLNLTGHAGGVIEKNILGKLLSIPDGDIDAHIAFFEKYGFLLPIGAESYESFESTELLEVVNRVKATIRLMNSIGKRNYRSVLVNIAYLLYSPIITFSLSNSSFSTCPHRYSQLIDSYNLFPDISREQEVFEKGTYSVNDTFLGRANPVDYDFYNAVRSGENTNLDGSKSPWFKKLMAMYVGLPMETVENRTLIDFFYHFQTEVSVFKDVTYKKIVPFTHINEDGFTDEIKATLLKVARIVIAAEINHNISGIHPRYNGSKLTAAWQVDNLLQALYFSVFYMKAGVEIYKECENPNCKRDKFFLVEATRTNKKYCCPQCANAAAAQRHRNKQLEM